MKEHFITRPNVFQYDSPSTFLRDSYAYRKSVSPSFSYSSWSRSLAGVSRTTLIHLVKGRRLPTIPVAIKIASSLKLGATETDYYTDLVELFRSKDRPGEAIQIRNRLEHQKEKTISSVINLDHNPLLSHWQACAIREMASTSHFNLEANKIRKLLYDVLSETEVQTLLQAMIDRGYLVRKKGKLVPATPHVTSQQDAPSNAIKNYHKAVLNRAILSQHLSPTNERQIIGTTFAMRSEDLVEAKRSLREWLDKFADRFESAEGDRVFQLELCLFPLTRRLDS